MIPRSQGLESKTLEVYQVLYFFVTKLTSPHKKKPFPVFPLFSPRRGISLHFTTTVSWGLLPVYCQCSLKTQGFFSQLTVKSMGPGIHPSGKWAPLWPREIVSPVGPEILPNSQGLEFGTLKAHLILHPTVAELSPKLQDKVFPLMFSSRRSLSS